MSSAQYPASIKSLGPCRFDSPLPLNTTLGDDTGNFTPDEQRVRGDVYVPPAEDELTFEKAGPRQKLFFDPATTRAAVVTCGGLCPGLNNVIRSVVVALQLNYGVRNVLGIRYGYQGLCFRGDPPVKLTLDMVDGIDKKGGTILGSSRGTPTSAEMADFLQAQRIDMLFTVGGDGTQRGAHALHEELQRRGAKIAVVGIPKTIDNDIQLCDQTFGFATAIEIARQVLDCAHVESKGVDNGVGLVKLMGRDSGFIAVGATLASQEVNFALIPEQKFALHGEKGFLAALEKRLLHRKHAVIALAEGAGQHLFPAEKVERDASGNVKHQDIGPFMKQQIVSHFAQRSIPVEVKYIDPSYIIRSVPANCADSLLCDSLARRAVHAGMAGKTDLLVAVLHHAFIHVPITLATEKRRQVHLEGEGWSSVLGATGQPHEFV
ncbi:MAG: ATP-dependent 6-phosphofructokinase [Pirellulales bacterium]|nr:ATP-dependent 6-phosphofructokinase [Pirellulales bacterium]